MKEQVFSIFSALEGDGEILTFRCDASGVPLWRLFRYQYSRSILDKFLWPEANKDRFFISPQSPTLKARLKSAAMKAVYHTSTWRQTPKDLHLAPSSQRIIGKLSEKYSDLSQLLTTFKDRSFVWENVTQHTPGNYPILILCPSIGVRPPTAGRRITFNFDSRMLSLLQFIRSRLDAAGVPDNFRPSDQAVRLFAGAKLCHLLDELPFWRDRFCKARPKLIVAEDGVYANQIGLMIAASEAGIRSAEMQHGVLSLGHIAYNCPPAWHGDEALRASWPDILLTYGSWWNSQTTLPWRDKIVIGRRRAKRPQNTDELRSDVLVVGDAVDIQSYLEFCAALAPVLKARGLRVVFRPHPSTRKQLSSRKNYSVDISEGSLAHALQRARLVVGTYSTVLFEAIDRVPAIVMWDTPARKMFFPKAPFKLVTQPEEILEILEADSVALIEPGVEKFWKPYSRKDAHLAIDRIITS